ncbi:MAG: hypothetical protein JNL79_22655 [Myxococcales bacterium]|nr:hypothetical protein [Myxococcales bacterium]
MDARVEGATEVLGAVVLGAVVLGTEVPLGMGAVAVVDAPPPPPHA